MKEITRICTICNIEKPLNDNFFNKNRASHRGLYLYRCKICLSRMSNEKIKLSQLNNPKKAQEYRKKVSTLNSIKRQKLKNFFIQDNKARQKIIDSESLLKNDKPKKKTYKVKQNNEYKKKNKRHINFRINVVMCVSMKRLSRNHKNKKPWSEIVGYTLEDLKKHLENLFQPGMTWENYGKGGWVIDHKIPVSAFNYTKPEHEDFKRCWALSNLQPMWEKENGLKSNKLDKHFQPSLLL